MFDLRPLLNLSFWFDLQPQTLSPAFEKFFFIFFGSMVVLGAIVRIVARHKKKEDRYLVATYKKSGQLLLTMGILGMTIYFFTFEEIYLLGARFWFLLWGIGFIVWIVQIVRYVKVSVPEMRKAHQKGKEEERYMPKKK